MRAVPAPANDRATAARRNTSDRRTRSVWLAGAWLLVAPTWLAFSGGGFDTDRQLVALAGTLVVLALLAATAPRSLGVRGLSLVSSILFAALVAWTAVSVAWAPIADAAVGDSERLLLYLAVFVAALLVMGVEALRRAAPVVLLAGCVVVAAYALAGRTLPDLVPVAASTRAFERLSQPLGYWNAMGILMALGAALALAVAGDHDRSHRLRSLAAGAAVPCGVALYLTFSRGALLALLAALVVLAALRPRKGIAAAAALAGVGAGALALAAQGFPAVLRLDQGRAEQVSQGARFILMVGAVTVVVAVVYRLVLRAPGIDHDLGVPRRLRIAVGVVTVLALLGASLALAFKPQTAEPLPTSEGRLAELRTNRGAYWEVALEGFAARPLVGGGSGSFRVDWRREREIEESVMEAHSLYIETLAELGLVGTALLAAFLGTGVVGLVRLGRRRPGDPLLLAATAVLVAFAIHAGVDWDWEMPAVTLVALLLLAAVLRAQEA
ncbi:MAG: O-antigen ligase family protein [Actinomycetota bacterium]|nr:O-antigen ligase family protein [Actinomycetota bacterium]MDQ3720786.1 O-antigen ligase family protein [Actinomycetota bacterium]